MWLLPCPLVAGRVVVVMGSVVGGHVVDLESVMVQDAVSQIIEKFEDGPCLLGCPFGIDEEADAAIEARRLVVEVSGHAEGSFSLAAWLARC